MRGARLAIVALVAALVVIASPRGAAADAPIELHAQASATKVEVGEPFTVELKAVTDRGGSMPSDPQIRPPAGFTSTNADISSQSVMQMFNGRTQVKMGISASWQLTASAVGHFVIPAPSVMVGNGRQQANPIPIDVVPSTGRQRQQPSSPFLMPGGGSLPWPFGGQRPAEPDLDDADEAPQRDLSIDVAPDPQIFLRAVLDKTTAVVGEQVTISFYIYYRANFEMTERHEASLDDFVRIPLLKNPGADPPVYATAGGHKYAVRLLDRVALFPVRAGTLHTGSLSGRFVGTRIGSHVREANDTVVTVTEPPLAGRPTGYAIGDVGQFTLSAAVQPRRIDQGGAVAVTITLKGTGNLPESLRVPARTGVEWLDPEKKASIDPVGTAVAGFRTFGYVVRLTDSGSIDLGKIDLPFWDPVGKRYQVASVTLGNVDVQPVAAATPAPGSSAGTVDASAGSRGDPFATLPGLRRDLAAFRAPRDPWPTGAPFWWLLAAPPILFVGTTMGARAIKSTRARAASAKTSAQTLAVAALREVDAALAKGDPKAVAAAAERAIHHSIEAATGLRSRGVLITDVGRELEQRGVSADLAARAGDALAACEALRFDPGASVAAISSVGDAARAVAQGLGARKANG